MSMTKYGISIIGLIVCSVCTVLYGQSVSGSYSDCFQRAYQRFPDIPKGILEAVAYTNTRIHHITHKSDDPESCSGMPLAYGVMGLYLDGKGYFDSNLQWISRITGYDIKDMISDPESNIMAYASAYHFLVQSMGIYSKMLQDHIPVLESLIALPGGTVGREFARYSQLYSILSFLNQKENQIKYAFPNHHLHLKDIFGENNYHVLSSRRISISGNHIQGDFGELFVPTTTSACNDYLNALWVPADASNYSSRNGSQITAITIHDIEGTYAGCISWFQNPNANVSAHYVLRSSDGQITQMVCEIDKAWHVGSENPYTIGLEHEGYANQQGWYTSAMYIASADLVKDICTSGYGINPHRTAYWPWAPTTYYNQSNIPGACVRIKGHQHFPNQTHTDPGPNWDWDYYFKLINDNPSITLLSSSSGQFFDSGGSSADYGNDERLMWLIQPPNADSITLHIISFSLEQDWDYLYVYNGSSEFDSLIGYYTGNNIPPQITATGGAMLIEFRSDCAITDSGWGFSWTSSILTRTAERSHNKQPVLYPNPAHSFFTLVGIDHYPAMLQLYDLSGRRVLQSTIQNSKTKINVCTLARGMYIYKAASGNNYMIGKLSVE